MLMTKGVREPFLVTTTQTSKYPSSSNRVYTLCSYPTTVTAVIISDVVSGYILQGYNNTKHLGGCSCAWPL